MCFYLNVWMHKRLSDDLCVQIIAMAPHKHLEKDYERDMSWICFLAMFDLYIMVFKSLRRSSSRAANG